jgi:hypothetical protein
MTSIHDQAMNHVYQQILHRLMGFFSRAERTALQLLIQRLVVAAGGSERIGTYKVLAIQSGSRDSCYTLAFLRAAQLSIAGRSPATFQLRVASLQLNGTRETSLENIHRCYSALFLYDDPRVEVLMADNREVLPFSHPAPISEAGFQASRINFLMVGHRRTREGALDLWDNGYLANGEFYGQIARWDGGVDALISCETPRQQRQFLEGLKRATAKSASRPNSQHETDFGALFALLDELKGDCYRAFYPELNQEQWRPAERFEACRRTTFIDTNDLLISDLEERWPLLTEFLGYRPDALPAPFGENEYVSLGISAHLRGLEACFMHGGNYDAGVTEFFQRALVMMRRKQASDSACQQAEKLFAKLATQPGQRELAAQEAQKSHGLSESQLVCLLFAPFVNKGEGLERFLRRCHPGMLVAMPDLHRAMQGQPVREQILLWMADVSGLSISLIGKLYRMAPLTGDASNTHAVSSDGSIALAGEWSAGR